MRRVPSRVLLAAGLLVSLLLAGVVSFHASGSPDGLERIAEDQGLLDRAEEHAAAGGPLADYRTDGVDDDRLAGGLAGVTGVLTVLVLVSGVTYAIRRRGPRDENEPEPHVARRG
jgi:cobalt/nickel transport system permease protein